MPVEIRELIIRAYVESENQGDNKSKNSSSQGEQEFQTSEEIVHLLETINNKNER